MLKVFSRSGEFIKDA